VAILLYPVWGGEEEILCGRFTGRGTVNDSSGQVHRQGGYVLTLGKLPFVMLCGLSLWSTMTLG
jgi:hypothetical protein